MHDAPLFLGPSVQTAGAGNFAGISSPRIAPLLVVAEIATALLAAAMLAVDVTGSRPFPAGSGGSLAQIASVTALPLCLLLAALYGYRLGTHRKYALGRLAFHPARGPETISPRDLEILAEAVRLDEEQGRLAARLRRLELERARLDAEGAMSREAAH